jgi:hypothetical protein
MMAPHPLLDYQAERDGLLQRIIQGLEHDPRFVAAWLSGSFAWGNADEVSDLDLAVVVSKEFAAHLCARPDLITAWPPAERLKLFRQFGDIGFAYENNYNAPSGGAATNVLYTPSGVQVDWTLVSEDAAYRPAASQLLFARRAVPVLPETPSASPAERAKSASDRIGFFWLMAAVTAKYMIRGDEVFVMRWLEELVGLVQDVERQIAGRPWQYRRGSATQLRTRAEQLEQLRRLCQRVEELSSQVVALGGDVWPSAKMSVEPWLSMAHQRLSSRPPGAADVSR